MGLLYWYVFYPAHWVIFTCLLKKMAGQARGCEAETGR